MIFHAHDRDRRMVGGCLLALVGIMAIVALLLLFAPGVMQ